MFYPGEPIPSIVQLIICLVGIALSFTWLPWALRAVGPPPSVDDVGTIIDVEYEMVDPPVLGRYDDDDL